MYTGFIYFYLQYYYVHCKCVYVSRVKKYKFISVECKATINKLSDPTIVKNAYTELAEKINQNIIVGSCYLGLYTVRFVTQRGLLSKFLS